MSYQESTAAFGPRKVAVYLANPGAGMGSFCVAELPDSDRRHAAARRFARDRVAFLAARKLLRELLAERLGCPPREVPIVAGRNGKPRLAGAEIEFSVSHCNGWCAVALADDFPVGVDVEVIRPVRHFAEVVAEFFPPAARAAFIAAPREQRHASFFRWWARIEAAVKACGRGLDDAASCFSEAVTESFDDLPGIALAVSAQGPSLLKVDWHIPPSDQLE